LASAEQQQDLVSLEFIHQLPPPLIHFFHLHSDQSYDLEDDTMQKYHTNNLETLNFRGFSSIMMTEQVILIVFHCLCLQQSVTIMLFMHA